MFPIVGFYFGVFFLCWLLFCLLVWAFFTAFFVFLLFLLILPLSLDCLSREIHVFIGVEEFVSYFLVFFCITIISLWNRYILFLRLLRYFITFNLIYLNLRFLRVWMNFFNLIILILIKIWHKTDLAILYFCVHIT